MTSRSIRRSDTADRTTFCLCLSLILNLWSSPDVVISFRSLQIAFKIKIASLFNYLTACMTKSGSTNTGQEWDIKLSLTRTHYAVSIKIPASTDHKHILVLCWPRASSSSCALSMFGFWINDKNQTQWFRVVVKPSSRDSSKINATAIVRYLLINMVKEWDRIHNPPES